MKRLLLSLPASLALLIALLSSSLLLAQDTSTDDFDDPVNIEELGPTEQQAQADQSDGVDELIEEDTAIAAAVEIAEADEGEESSARFIPTEEISQDLGVSFPVDI